MTKKYSLEEAIPLVANGREFSFVWEGINKILSKDCHFQLNILFDYRFELIPNHIKSLDELKDLKMAVCAEAVLEKVNGHWYSIVDGAGIGSIRSSQEILNIENWQYFEGGE